MLRATAVRSPKRDELLRESHRLNHELGYIGFRHEFVNDPDGIRQWPDPAVRERELRRFWDEHMEGSFAAYQKDFAHYSVGVLAAYCDYLRDILAGDRDSQIAYYHRVSEMGRGMRLGENGLHERGPAKDRPATPSEIARESGAGRAEQGYGQDRGQQEKSGRGR